MTESILKNIGRKAWVNSAFEESSVSKNDGRDQDRASAHKKERISWWSSLEEMREMMTGWAMALTRILWKRIYLLKNKWLRHTRIIAFTNSHSAFFHARHAKTDLLFLVKLKHTTGSLLSVYLASILQTGFSYVRQHSF